MAMASQQQTWRLESLQYLGEISALCFIPLPHLSPSPFLLAGTGSQVLVYDVEAGKSLSSLHVFDGIRVHGISCSLTDLRKCGPSLTASIKIAVFGERRVKLFSLHFDMMSDYHESHKVNVNLLLINVLPRLNHWVMDVSFLRDHMLCKCEVDNHLAVGLSNNSVFLWDISKSNIILEVKCPERCLLYSMRLWGDSIKALRVASGTIYNEIIVWKLSQQTPTSASLMEGYDHTDGSSFKSADLYDLKFDAILLGRLTGHEGSIFRISWSSDGSKLLSASDDRSARVWSVSGQIADSNEESVSIDVSLHLTLFGHNARVWDCCISDSVIITAGEDCTCRVWSLDGLQLTVIKEHVGRGIWRCLYDQSSSLLITAGFDSAIKVHRLQSSLFGNKNEDDKIFKKFKDRTEVFKIEMPDASEELGLMDSKSEYVRCLRFGREDVLYVATNHGYLYHAKLYGPGDVEWTKLIQIGKKVPVICMDLLQSNSADFSKDIEDWIVFGDGAGDVTVVRILDGACGPKIDLSFTWSAEKERQLLGAYWCKSLGSSYLFTADPRGRLKLWKVDIITTNISINHQVSLVAYFTSYFGARVLCIDASLEEEVLVCGDQRGNLIMFPLLKTLLLATSMKSEESISPLTYFKGAHGISSVSSIVITAFNSKEVEIISTGGDGCICYFKYKEDRRSLEFTGMNQVKELSLIQSVFSSACSFEDLAHGNYAIGFASANFIIWDLVNETKILLVACGGWRRPHSYFLGEVPEIQNCFAYLKDHTVHVHRLWASANDRKHFPQVLHMQYHGREIHSLCFVSVGLQVKPTTDHHHELSWVATGCEDGTVRLTRYDTLDFAGWSVSKLLGEHVGGSAVRSICFISKTYTTGHTYTNCGKCSNNAIVDDGNAYCLLISVGAKRVLTSWLLGNNRHKKAAPIQGAVQNTGNVHGLKFQSMSFQWLSTHMPPKFASRSGGHKSIDNEMQLSERVKNATVTGTSSMSAAYITENHESTSKLIQDEQSENDWRYMAVTAFLVKGADSRLTICFVVVACSDATVTLRALLLPSRLWFDVALLVPQTSPVLTLQHLVIPVLDPSEGRPQVGNQYIVISGSTDGSIAFWDLTDTVESFMLKVLMLQPEKLIDCHRRPKTGRGSQGGRWWRSLTNQSAKKGPSDVADRDEVREDTDHGTIFEEGLDSSEFGNRHSGAAITSTQRVNTDSLSAPEVQSNEHLNGIQKLWPMHVLKFVHQSGVNCLHVSGIENFQYSDPKSVHCVISGGDDQALNCLVFDLPLSLTSLDNGLQQTIKSTKPTDFSDPGEMSKPSSMRFFCNDRISSAHSSAVKGVWTDGAWVFSCGLDQRIRCWSIGENGKLIERARLVISVPEPEALDARPCSRNQYQIVIAGRGMQMVQFSAFCTQDHAQ